MPPSLAVVFAYGSATPMELVAAARDVCDLVFVCDPSDHHVKALLPLLRMCGRVVEQYGDPQSFDPASTGEISGVIAFGERELPRAARIAAHHRLPFHSSRTVAALTDKRDQRARLAAGGLDTVRIATIDSEADALPAMDHTGTPAVLKPRHGMGGRNTYLISHRWQIREAVVQSFNQGETSLVLEQALLGDPSIAGPAWGDYISIESLSMDGKVTHLGVTGKTPLAEPFRETGFFFPSTLTPDMQASACEVTTAALRSLGIRHGISHTELKLTAEGPKVIEVNGRLGGYVNDVFARSTGQSVIRQAMTAALGQAVSAEPLRARCVAYQLFISPPVWARSLSAIDGVEETRSIPGVKHVVFHRNIGDAIDWRVGTDSAVATVYGETPDHQELMAVKEKIDQTLVIEYAT
ncbi:biotin carboxylase [Streptomyces sp. V4I23]|uniref:ATP-grasp domain-containing protein n=1 Tax=Streptomyces sp. V4I23 TaxID=3042282 RepID=UPI0027815EEA|nr:ATP-grasp domain-containing protein [Streptomyces sp. V4I23]MDQ1005777.1 biotin carboxylase [Streptomyces sp. V4I23]